MNYIIDEQGNKRPTQEMVDAYIDDWGEDAKHGYAIFDFDCTGMLEIEMINEMGIFNGDEEAVEQAMKDGIKIIPIEEYCSDEGNYYVNGHSWCEGD